MQKHPLIFFLSPQVFPSYSSHFSMEIIICWQDYIANPSTMDMAYNVLIDHALAESDRRYAFRF